MSHHRSDPRGGTADSTRHHASSSSRRYNDYDNDVVMEVQKQMASRQDGTSWQNSAMPNWNSQNNTMPLVSNLSHVAGVLETPAQQQERKQREIYVGNLAMGIVTRDIIEEFFNQALSHLVADPVRTPPVVQVKMEGSGRFAFLELRTQEIAKQALRMDKLVELHGRVMNVGRPKGYIEDYQAPDVGSSMGPSVPTTVVEPFPTQYLLLANIWPAEELKDEKERTSLKTAVLKEAKVHGNVQDAVVPEPPTNDVVEFPLRRGRVYLEYATVEDAKKGRDVFHTRTLNDSFIYARFVSQDEFEKAKKGEWVDRTPSATSTSGLDLPGLYTLARYAAGVSGLTVLSPTQGPLMQHNQSALRVLAADMQVEEVPFEHGWVKLRGFKQDMSKDDIVSFFKEAGTLSHDDIKVVHSADGAHLGEAYIHFHEDDARLRVALAKDGSSCTSSGTATSLEVFTAFEADLERRIYSGCQIK